MKPGPLKSDAARNEDAITALIRTAVEATAGLTEDDWQSIPPDGAQKLDHYLYGRRNPPPAGCVAPDAPERG